MLNERKSAPYLPENLWGYGKRLRFIDDALLRAFPGKLRSIISILDVGCGNGSQLAIPLARAAYQVTAIDPHLASIHRGRSFGSEVRFMHGTIRDVPPQLFDCVILSEVLEHLDAPETLLVMVLDYLAPRGVLMITGPNGYGEFELDRRLYQFLRLDKLVAWLHSFGPFQRKQPSVASSDSESPHVQRFTLATLRAMFRRHDLQVLEARGTSLLSGPFVAHLLARFQTFVRLNAAIADRLPLPVASGWMFILRRPLERVTKVS